MKILSLRILALILLISFGQNIPIFSMEHKNIKKDVAYTLNVIGDKELLDETTATKKAYNEHMLKVNAMNYFQISTDTYLNLIDNEFNRRCFITSYICNSYKNGYLNNEFIENEIERCKKTKESHKASIEIKINNISYRTNVNFYLEILEKCLLKN